MANNLRKFNTYSDYEAAELVKPAVSLIAATDEVYFDQKDEPVPPTPVFQGKWKATYQDSHTESAQCGSSSEIAYEEIDSTGLVSVEIGNCVTSIGENAFFDCSSLTSVNIPSGVTTIGDAAFNSCRNLTSCTIGNCVTSIGENAFFDCSGLTSINIPSGVTSIGRSAFMECTSLTSCTIGDGVTSIGEMAFRNCSGLTSITVNATTPPTLGIRVFNSTNNCPIYVPSASVNAYKTATNWSSYASRIQAIP